MSKLPPQSRQDYEETREAERIRVSTNNAVPGRPGEKQVYTTKLFGDVCAMAHSAAPSAQTKKVGG